MSQPSHNYPPQSNIPTMPPVYTEFAAPAAYVAATTAPPPGFAALATQFADAPPPKPAAASADPFVSQGVGFGFPSTHPAPPAPVPAATLPQNAAVPFAPNPTFPAAAAPYPYPPAPYPAAAPYPAYGQAYAPAPYPYAPAPAPAPYPYGQPYAPAPAPYYPQPPAAAYQYPAAGGYAAPAGGYGPPQFHPPSGKKKALLIGINYFRTPNELKGCINDVKNFQYFLETKWGFKKEDMLVLTDDNLNPMLQPTRGNIFAGFRWLLLDARPGDSLVFQYSGHGSQVRDTNGDEDDGMDETILPVDYKTAGQIVDDEIFSYLVRPIPAGVKLTGVMDCCHSGTGMDLPFNYSGAQNTGGANAMLAQMGYGGFTWKGSGRGRQPPPPACYGDVILFSGCSDSQTSADTNALARVVTTGAMTFALINGLERGGAQQTYAQLFVNLRAAMKGRFTQTPQLSTAKPFNLNQIFSL